jgi:uncharacterized membrane protein
MTIIATHAVLHPSIRRRGLWKMGIGLLVAAAWFAIVYYCTANTRWRFYGPALGLPAVPFVIGCVELATGRTFADLSRRWDALRPWQRGLLGLAIVVAAFIGIALTMGAVAMSLAS